MYVTICPNIVKQNIQIIILTDNMNKYIVCEEALLYFLLLELTHPCFKTLFKIVLFI